MTQTGNLNKTIQAQRFDRWKDPQGVIEACKSARRTTDCMLVLVGSKADDDPKTAAVLESVQASASERVLVLSVTDQLRVNALQRRAAVILHKSIREGSPPPASMLRRFHQVHDVGVSPKKHPRDIAHVGGTISCS